MEEDEPKKAKWPWSITEREFGRLEQALQETRHDLKNLKITVDASDLFKSGINESLIKLDNLKARLSDLDKLRAEFNQFKAKVYTAGAVVVLLAGAVAWLVDVVLRIMP